MTDERSREEHVTDERSREEHVTDPGWIEHAIWWQIYPLGFVGALPADPAPTADEHRLRRVVDWLDHAVELGASGLALGPVFASRTHGYDTTDHYRIDPRLGDDADFDHVVSEAHATRPAGPARRGVQPRRNRFPPLPSRQRRGGDTSWFRVRNGQFDTFEGHDGLIALEPPTRRGRRLHRRRDVALAGARRRRLAPRRGLRGARPLLGAGAPPGPCAVPATRGSSARSSTATTAPTCAMPDSTRSPSTNCGRRSGAASTTRNFHELDWALKRHNEFLDAFVPLTFIGNHDVTRIASMLDNPDHVEHALVILLTTGGTPSIYAGDESAYRGVKEERFGGDDAVRPEFGSPHEGVGEHGQQIFRAHQHLIGLRRRHPWLHTARTTPLRVTNEGYVYATRNGDDALVVALNVDDAPMSLSLADFGFAAGEVVAGSGAPPSEVLADAVVPPHGWLILLPR